MTAPKVVRADYDALKQVEQRLKQHSDACGQTLQRIQQAMDALEGGNWKGEGAKAFFREMNSDVLPSWKRLVAVLESASQTILKVSQIMQQAEAEAAMLFILAGAAAGASNLDRSDQILRLLSYSLFDWAVTAKEEKRILELLKSSNLSQVIRDLDTAGMLDALLSRVDAGNNRRHLLRLLGTGLDDSARELVEPQLRALGIEAELQYNLARLGVDFAPADFDRSSYAHLISSEPGDPFTAGGASGVNATTLSVPLTDQIPLGLDDPATWSKHSNPLGSLNLYLEGLTI